MWAGVVRLRSRRLLGQRAETFPRSIVVDIDDRDFGRRGPLEGWIALPVKPPEANC
jgi:hypothetical protein